MLHCPFLLSPTATAQPSLRRRTVWVLPADTWAYKVPSGNCSISHCPAPFHPKATAVPSLWRSTVWPPPAEAIFFYEPNLEGGFNSWAKSFSPIEQRTAALPANKEPHAKILTETNCRCLSFIEKCLQDLIDVVSLHLFWERTLYMQFQLFQGRPQV